MKSGPEKNLIEQMMEVEVRRTDCSYLENGCFRRQQHVDFGGASELCEAIAHPRFFFRDKSK